VLSIHLKIVGCALVALALLHPAIARHLRWRDDLKHTSLLTRQIFAVHSFFIALVLVLMGVLAAGFTETLIAPSPLGRLVLSGLTIFWFARLVVQLLVYDRSHWRGNPRNTVIHVTFTLFWLYCVVVFGWGAWQQWKLAVV